MKSFTMLILRLKSDVQAVYLTTHTLLKPHTRAMPSAKFTKSILLGFALILSGPLAHAQVEKPVSLEVLYQTSYVTPGKVTEAIDRIKLDATLIPENEIEANTPVFVERVEQPTTALPDVAGEVLSPFYRVSASERKILSDPLLIRFPMPKGGNPDSIWILELNQNTEVVMGLPSPGEEAPDSIPPSWGLESFGFNARTNEIEFKLPAFLPAQDAPIFVVVRRPSDQASCEVNPSLFRPSSVYFSKTQNVQCLNHSSFATNQRV